MEVFCIFIYIYSIQINITYNENENKYVDVVDFSPAGRGRHVIVEDHTFGDDRGFYVASIWES